MNLEAFARAGRVDAKHIAVACSALARQLRDVHRTARDRGANEELRGVRVETCEALMNLLAVLDADGEHPAIRSRLRTQLAGALRDARKHGLGG